MRAVDRSVGIYRAFPGTGSDMTEAWQWCQFITASCPGDPVGNLEALDRATGMSGGKTQEAVSKEIMASYSCRPVGLLDPALLKLEAARRIIRRPHQLLGPAG